MDDDANGRPWRYRWSHEAFLHRLLVRQYNAFSRIIPLTVKYSIGRRLRANRYPYRLVEPGSSVVQVGAPRDTLLSGRSRAMYFSLFAGDNGRVFVVEPDENSVRTFNSIANNRNIRNVEFTQLAAWSEETFLTIYVDDEHPASNFSAGSKDYDEKRMQDYRPVEIPADSLDNILSAKGVNRVDLVSITTNGAEPQILDGMRSLMAAGLPYICLAVTGSGYVKMMQEYGYELLGHDDRGFTFSQIRRES